MPDSGSEPASAYAAQLTDTVFIVDDDPLVRSALEITLSLAGLKSVKFASAQQFLAHVTAEHSGCVLTDIRMPGMDGLELQEELVRRNACMSVIVMTGHADVPLAVRAMKAGALDILEKPFRNELLVERVNAALVLARQKSEQALRRDTIAARFHGLSDRERDVLKLVADGKSSKEIGRLLDISPRTVDGHRFHVMEKMQAENVAALVRMMAVIL
jgi:two-component system response regulator FixJ